MTYDSRKDTLAHIADVASNIHQVIGLLHQRSMEHDLSKLADPEKAIFDEYTPKLRESTYGSEEYEQFRREMGAALQHHYAHNSHHPEHYENGVAGMSLLDLIEMLCDWKAATKRHADGNIGKSLTINKQRFGLDDQLASILENTIREMGW
jgi:hypothetical protein